MTSNVSKTAESLISQWTFAGRALELESSIIRDILKVTSLPEVISFAGGLPAPELFPIEGLRKACRKVLEEIGPAALQYSLTTGVPPLKRFLAERVSKQGFEVDEGNIQVTAGSQQGLDLVGRLFVEPGNVVITEIPTYLGAIQAFNFYGAKYVSVPMDENGVLVEELEDRVKKSKPRIIYIVPNFQNPSGITLSEERRHQLVEVAKRYEVPIIEDNPYGELRYAGKEVPSIQSIGGDYVIQLQTFSKIISPGLRIGWISASKEIMALFERVKQSTDLHTNTFCQYVITEFAKDGSLDRHIEELKVAYSERRQVMLNAMEAHFPEEVNWTKPEGGLFLWVELPRGMNSAQLLDKAVERKVAYVPGSPFYAQTKGENTMRLNFSNASPEKIVEGIRRLGQVIKENLPKRS
ncbi:MAG: PLP-dependent aminotransferase family protein [Candidatus Zixiibacteriota bacterium]